MTVVLILIVIVAGVVGKVWYESSQAKKGIETPMAREQRLKREADAKIVCPHCQTAGQVTVRDVKRKKGISGGKATGAVLTGGASMLVTGLSRKEPTKELTCGNCRMKWDA